MSKEIKFRVWNKSSKTWVIPHQKDHYLQPWYMVSFSGEIMYGDNQGAYVETHQENYVIQQYTGCKDSNGKDIYEGDIIKDTWKENRPYGYRQDEWDDEENVFVVKYHGPAFNLTITYSGDQTCIEDFKREVIGNIYENPELLS